MKRVVIVLLSLVAASARPVATAGSSPTIEQFLARFLKGVPVRTTAGQ
jgi:hypothetical protein